MKAISDKVKQAEKWNEEKIIEQQIKEKYRDIQDTALSKLKLEVNLERMANR